MRRKFKPSRKFMPQSETPPRSLMLTAIMGSSMSTAAIIAGLYKLYSAKDFSGERFYSWFEQIIDKTQERLPRATRERPDIARFFDRMHDLIRQSRDDSRQELPLDHDRGDPRLAATLASNAEKPVERQQKVQAAH